MRRGASPLPSEVDCLEAYLPESLTLEGGALVPQYEGARFPILSLQATPCGMALRN